QVRVRYAETEHEAAARELGHRLLDGAHRHRIAGVDVRDAGGELQTLGARRQIAEQGEGIAADRLRQPERRVPERLDPLHECGGLAGAHQIEEGPDAETAELHAAILLSLPACDRRRDQAVGSFGAAAPASSMAMAQMAAANARPIR